MAKNGIKMDGKKYLSMNHPRQKISEFESSAKLQNLTHTTTLVRSTLLPAPHCDIRKLAQHTDSLIVYLHSSALLWDDRFCLAICLLSGIGYWISRMSMFWKLLLTEPKRWIFALDTKPNHPSRLEGRIEIFGLWRCQSMILKTFGIHWYIFHEFHLFFG